MRFELLQWTGHRGSPAWITLARGLTSASVLYATWALAILPGEFFSIRDNLRHRHTFYENIALVPILAAVGALALLAIHKTAGAGADANTWRGWFAARGQVLVAILVALAQLWFVHQAACPACDPFPAHIYALLVVTVLAFEAAWRFFAERRSSTTSSSTNSPAE